jgi:hypothetical protein
MERTKHWQLEASEDVDNEPGNCLFDKEIRTRKPNAYSIFVK